MEQLPCPGGERANTLPPPKLHSSYAVPRQRLSGVGQGCLYLCFLERESLGSAFPVPPQSSPAGKVSLLLVLHSAVYGTNSFAYMFVYKKTETPEWPHSTNASCKQIQIFTHTQRLLELNWGMSCREEIASNLQHVSFK